MSLHGVRQLKELIVRYSDLDGSSRGVRDWMRTSLVTLASSNPELEIKTELKRAVHPYLRASYRNGNTKTICIKNLPVEEIQTYALFLRNQIGRRVSFVHWIHEPFYDHYHLRQHQMVVPRLCLLMSSDLLIILFSFSRITTRWLEMDIKDP